jgi:cell division protein FtsL
VTVLVRRDHALRKPRNNTGSSARRAKTRASASLKGVGGDAASPFGGVLVPVVLVLVVMSALAVVQSSHQARQLFSELQDLRRDAMKMEEEWGRLLLEQSTWASPDRIQRLSEGKLKMRAPEIKDVVIVRSYGDSA